MLATAAIALSAAAPTQALTRDELELIAEGFQVFTTETFGGNGRTCKTCHLPNRNYNISPADIAELSDADKALVLASNVPELENATLVERLALFNINEEHAPGNGNTPVGPFRGSMTIAGLAFTTDNDFCTVPNQDNLPALTQCGAISTTPNERANEPVNDGTRRVALGWAGDGGIGLHADVFPDVPASADCKAAVEAANADPTDLTARLRAFSLGAVRTHDTLSMARVPGVDFRRQRVELDLTQVEFTKDPSEGPGPGVAEEGRALFLNDLATCNRCHFNAGANGSLGRVLQPDFDSDDPNPPDPAPSVPGAAKNSHTSTDLLRIAEVNLDDTADPVTIPRDIGDGRERGGVQADGQRAGGFNMQSLIEAPRKRAFFHNNGFATDVENAIAFYFTPTFDNSQGGSGRVAQIRYCAKPGNACPNEPALRLSGADAFAALGGQAAIDKLGFFLRALSAIYSLADCERLVEEMLQREALGLPTSLPAMHCQFALDDVRYVLENAKVSLPPQYQQLLAELPALEAELGVEAAQATTAAYGTPRSLRNLLYDLQRVRGLIAETPQLPNRAPLGAAAPVLGIAACAALVVALFGLALFRLRRS